MIRLLVAGIALTVIGLIGLGFLATSGEVRYLFIACYGLGALCLIGGGLWWLVRIGRGRDSQR